MASSDDDISKLADKAEQRASQIAASIALELLRRQVSDISPALVANAIKSNKGKEDGKGGKDQMSLSAVGKLATDPMAALASKFSAIIGPMALFGQILESNASGFQVLASAAKLLAGTLAPVLLPIVAVVAAGLVELSDKLWNEISPELEDFYEAVLDNLIPAVEEIVDAFIDAARIIMSMADPLDGAGKRITAVEEGRAVGMTDDEIRTQAKAANWSDTEIEKAIRGADKNRGGGGSSDESRGSGGGSRGSPGFKAAMGDVLKELRLSMGPKASIGDIASVGKNFQLASMNQSPFEVKMLERMDRAVTALEKVAGKSKPAKAPHTTSGSMGGYAGGWSEGAGGGMEDF